MHNGCQDEASAVEEIQGLIVFIERFYLSMPPRGSRGITDANLSH